MTGPGTERTSGRVAATVYEVGEEHVEVRTPDGCHWHVSRPDFPYDLAFVGTPVALVHDAEGFVTRIEPRPKKPLPSAVRERIDDLLEWAESL